MEIFVFQDYSWRERLKPPDRGSVGLLVSSAVFNPAFSGNFSGNEHGWTLMFRFGFGVNRNTHLSVFILFISGLISFYSSANVTPLRRVRRREWYRDVH